MSTSAAAANALTALNHALNIISAQRARLGSVTNRLQATVEVVSNQFQNLTSAESQIRDANMATEVTALTKWQILNQTGISALAQANQSAQLVTQLLQ
jgi:flagellin